MAQFLAPIINDQQFDANGDPLSGGTIEVYLAGTSTPAATTSDKAGAVPNTWPIVLNTLGVNNQGAVWLTGGATYKYVIKTAAGVPLRTIDNVSGINDSAVVADQWVVYQAAPTYVSATSFTVAGDQTQTFQLGRRLKTTNTGGTIYGTVTGSVYSSPNTTVTVRNDSGVLDSGLSAVSYSVLSVSDTSLPGGLFNYGQCRLTKSGANLVLVPSGGNRITIGGAICFVPSAGVSLAPTSLTPSTLYYIYAYMNGATLTLEASTTVHTMDTVTGVEIKTGDATRTLVGMARTIVGPAWQDTAAQRFVVSWFNQQPVQTAASFSSGRTTTSVGVFVELNTEIRNEFLAWTGKALSFWASGTISNNTALASCTSAMALDNTTALEGANSPAMPTGINNQSLPLGFSTVIAPPEGYHYITLLGTVSAGTGSWGGSASVGARCSIQGVIQG